MVGIIDYGLGNLMSVQNSLVYLGARSVISRDTAVLSECEKLILPGVGAFPIAIAGLCELGLDRFILSADDKPLLGICLGMQLLFSIGNEIERAAGLGLIDGEVRRIETELKLPHIGWNALRKRNASPLLDGVADGDYVYFVHSFCAECVNPADVVAVCDYGEPVTAIVQRGNVFGCQFHPEKSGVVGLKILDNFVKL